MDELQRLAFDLQLMVLREVTGHDADAAAMWTDELVDETFAEKPRLRLLRPISMRSRKKQHVLAIYETKSKRSDKQLFRTENHMAQIHLGTSGHHRFGSFL